MDTFVVALEVADPEGRHYETVDTIVDSGATYTVLPASVLERLGVVPHGTRQFVLADGSRVERGFGRTWMRLDGREDISPVVFWDEGAQPLLGAVTLEIFSLGIDPVNGRLMPVDALMLALGAMRTRRRTVSSSKPTEPPAWNAGAGRERVDLGGHETSVGRMVGPLLSWRPHRSLEMRTPNEQARILDMTT